MKQTGLTNIIPFDNDQKKLVETILTAFNDKQLTWLAGYLTGITLPLSLNTRILDSSGNAVPAAEPANKEVTGAGKSSSEHANIDIKGITVLFGTRTGNGQYVANQIKEITQNKGIHVDVKDMNDYPLNNLKEEKILLVIVSTHGEGIPPVAAEEFYEFIHSKRAPKLNGLKFSVLALGDRSYINFCKTGADIDKRLEELGGERVCNRVDCDVDFNSDALSWFKEVLMNLQNDKQEVKVNNSNSNNLSNVSSYNKLNPYQALLINKIKLNGRGSAKETYHFELSLENSGLTFEPGDSLGVYPINSPRIVKEVTDLLKLNPEETVEVSNTTTTLEDALSRYFELSSINPDVIKKYNNIVKSKELEEILADNSKLKDYIYGRDVVDLIYKYPAKLSPVILLGILRKLQPRLYSISSSLKTHPEEVHLTIAAVRYTNGRYKEGVCSTFLSDRITDNDKILIFTEKNPEFKLPSNTDAPVIMVGPGTGIAPFRAFLEERAAIGAKGRNWLFFGNWNFTNDFLYQTEFQSFYKKGLLTNLSVAFSRDTPNKIYVQHKMQQHSKELYSWLENGAYFYVCGDMKNMWNDVNQTLIKIISQEGGMSTGKAEEYLHQMKKAKRYQVDVY